MLGGFQEGCWTAQQYPNASSPNLSQYPWNATVDCSQGCLFNLEVDPNEHVEISGSHPDVVAELTARIRAVNETTFSPDRGQRDPRGCSTALGRYGGIWGPFSQLTADSDTHA